MKKIESKNSKKRIIHRAKIAEGHLRKVIKMIEDDEYCIKIITQSLAVQNALKKIDQLILDKHLNTCVIQAVKGKSETERKSKIKELSELFENYNKK